MKKNEINIENSTSDISINNSNIKVFLIYLKYKIKFK